MHTPVRVGDDAELVVDPREVTADSREACVALVGVAGPAFGGLLGVCVEFIRVAEADQTLQDPGVLHCG